MSDRLQRLNRLPGDEALTELIECCGSKRWAQKLLELRPFRDAEQLVAASDSIWQGLEARDWLEAFSHHPKIGERKAAREVSAASLRWSEEEQSAARTSSTETLDALAEANQAYEAKFGYIFIVCATGKTSAELLALLGERLPNDPETELRIAAREQNRITRLRLRKLLEQ